MEHITEHHSVPAPSVYGFLWLVNVSDARRIALIASLAEYCTQHELLLAGVFSDRKPTTGPLSAALAGLLDVLTLPDTYGVVLPAASHLGSKTIAAERKKRIGIVGARLLLVRARSARWRRRPLCVARRVLAPPARAGRGCGR